MEKTELISEIIHLYDKVDELQASLANKWTTQNGGYELPIKKALFDLFTYEDFKEVINDWAVPSATLNYVEWLEMINFYCLSVDFTSKFKTISLKDFKNIFQDYFAKYYDDKRAKLKKDEEKAEPEGEKEE